MARSPLVRPWLLVLLATLPILSGGCGVGDRKLPFIVGTDPVDRQPLAGPIAEIRIDYDEPVTILNPFDARVFQDNVWVATTTFQKAGDPDSVFIRPFSGGSFATGVTLVVQISAGTAINAQQHYAAGSLPYTFALQVPAEPGLPVCRGATVTLFDPVALTATGSTPTPAGRAAVAAEQVTLAAGLRTFVQLDNGAGGGDALAYFAPGDGAMTTVTLTTGGSTLAAAAPALTYGPSASFLYAAYRDATDQNVRIAKVDVATGTEVASLLLAGVPTGAATQPAGMALDATRTLLLITSHDGASGTLSYVDLATFAELDRDAGTPGMQGVALDMGAGPVVGAATFALVAPAGNADLTRVDTGTDALQPLPSTAVGANRALVRSNDAALLVQALANYGADLALQRSGVSTAYVTQTAVAVSDDVGGTSAGATSSRAIQALASGTTFLLLLETPTGLILTQWNQAGESLIQVDLDDLTVGIQALDVSASLAGASYIGTTRGMTIP